MKKCPKCQKTFDDSMKFCQTDGTPLVAVADDQTNENPYATMVGNQSDLPIPADDKSAEETKADADPYATIVGGGYSLPMDEADDKDDDDLLEIPGDNDGGYDPNKTMVAGGNTTDNYRLNIPEEKPQDAPEGFGSVGKSEAATMITPQIPKFDEPEIAPPDLDKLSETADSDKFSSDKEVMSPLPGSPFASDKSFAEDSADDEFMSNQSPFDNFNSSESKANASPFEVPQEPLKPEPLNEEKNVDFSEPPPFGEFDQQQNFGASDTDNWQPPAAPIKEFENKSIGQNTPFEPPAVAGGQDQTLAYVSLGAGIASFVCLGPIGSITALVTGYLAKKNITENPDKYGGATLATVGMVLGAINLLLVLLVIILWVILFAAAGS